VNAGPRIVHLDDRLAVIDKPAGLVVHPAPGVRGPTLVELLAELVGGGEPGRPGIVHRLDKDTSGLMVVARDPQAHRRLAAMVASRRLRRFYLALVEGLPRSRSGTIDAALGRDYRAPERRAVGGRGRREARTHFTVIEALASTALLEVRLETGRTHQIRVHLAAIGHPIVGDARYGHGGGLGLERQFLHSARLAFEHPFTGAELDLSSPLPADLDGALERARIHSDVNRSSTPRRVTGALPGRREQRWPGSQPAGEAKST
jgi:23S rRNA pseudouridine1911/1915/1917 synthase